MATNTHIALIKKTLDANSSAIELDVSGISSYTDLIIVFKGTSTVSANLNMRFNGSSASYYSNTGLRGNGSSATSYRQTNLDGFNLVSTADLANGIHTIIRINNFSSSSAYKTVLTRTGSGSEGTEIIVGWWRGATGSSTAAITTITLYPYSGNISSGSTVTVYGVKAEAPAPKATGGAIYTDAEYYYHVFGATGAFVPSQSLTADIITVAGGGGGQELGGGGGAGGAIEFLAQSLSATSYTVTVGAGGAGGYNGTGTVGANGSNSRFGVLTECIGGGGGGRYDVNGASGGSGGGGGRNGTSGGAGTAGQGYAGGNGLSGFPYAGGGGGGAGGAGGNATYNTWGFAGNGGIGITSSFINAIGKATGNAQFSSSAYYIAGGGGGGFQNGPGFGAGGAGGGGRGGSDRALPSRGANGIAGMGGGAGGGSGANAYGGNGGSGVVIVRYAK